MSFGYSREDHDLYDIIRACDRRILFFASASNDGARREALTTFPARLPGFVFCINSADGGGYPARLNPPAQTFQENFTTLGEEVDLAAISSNTNTQRVSGTSIATPIAAGIAALILEYTRQRHVRISQKDEVQTYRGMRSILLGMCKGHPVQRFRYINPSTLLNIENCADVLTIQMEIAGSISSFLRSEFGRN
jgi:hypothetical protein